MCSRDFQDICCLPLGSLGSLGFENAGISVKVHWWFDLKPNTLLPKVDGDRQSTDIK